MLERLFTTAELAEYLEMTAGSLSNWRTSGFGPRFIKVGTNVRYREPDIADWLESRSVAATSGHGWDLSDDQEG